MLAVPHHASRDQLLSKRRLKHTDKSSVPVFALSDSAFMLTTNRSKILLSGLLAPLDYKIRGEYPRLEPRDESDNSSTITMAGRDIHRSQTPNVNIEASINNYTDVQNVGSPPNPSSEDLQPRTGSGIA